MVINVAARGRNGDIRDAVGRLDVRAENDGEAAFLRRLYLALANQEPIQFTDAHVRWIDDDAPAVAEPKQPGKANGGRARAAALSPERRSEIAKKAAAARWAGRAKP
jgi:hypothetical protein